MPFKYKTLSALQSNAPAVIGGGTGWYGPGNTSEFLITLNGWFAPGGIAGDAGIKLQPTLGASPLVDFLSDTGVEGLARGRIGRNPNSGQAALFVGTGGATANALQIGNRDSTPVQFFSNDICRLMIDTGGGISIGAYASVNVPPANGLILDGSVGIGTNNPITMLEVAGVNSTPSLRLRRTNNTGPGSSMGGIALYAPNALGTNTIWAGIVDTVNNATAGSEDGSLIFQNRVAGAYGNALVLQANGALLPGGIGVWGHALPGAQPIAPVTLADVIAIIRGCGLSA